MEGSRVGEQGTSSTLGHPGASDMCRGPRIPHPVPRVMMMRLRPLLPPVLLLLGLLLTPFPSAAQTPQRARLSGVVRDADTGRGLPVANIRVLGTTIGTISNAEGAYLLVLDPGRYAVAFSYMGYASDTLRVSLGTGRTVRDVSLQPAVLESPPLVVRPDVGSLAEFIIAQAIARKQEVLSRLRTLRYDAYTRTLIKVLFEGEDREEAEYGGIAETRSRGWRAFPDEHTEVILARRQSANMAPAVNIFTAGPVPDFNRDRVTVERCQVTGPTAPEALQRYRFTLLDTLAMDGVRVYRLRVEPRNQYMPLFDGEISIAEGSWLVVDLDLRGNEAMDNRPFADWRFRQQFARYGEDFWLPIDARTDMTIRTFGMQVLVRMHAVLHDYRINPDIPPERFGRDVVEIASGADNPPGEVWEGPGVIPLSTEEERAYARIDSLMEEMPALLRKLMTLMQPGEPGPIRWGGFSDFIRFNRVQGFRLGGKVGLEVPEAGWGLDLKGGYGIQGEGWEWGLGTHVGLSDRPDLVFDAEVRDALAWREGPSCFTPGQITLLSLLEHIDPVDYYRRRGVSAGIRWRPSRDLDLRLGVLSESHRSLGVHSSFSLFERDRDYRANPAIEEGTLHGLRLDLSLDTRRFLPMGDSRTPDESRDWWQTELSVETSRGGAWDSDFSYTRWGLRHRHHMRTFAAGHLDLILSAGLATGRIPIQRFFDLKGGLKLIHRPAAMGTVGFKEFAGDRLLSIWIEHNFGSLPLQILGIRARGVLDVDLLAHMAGGWTGLGTRSGPIPDGTRTTGPPRWEAGVGIARLAGFLRMDIMRSIGRVRGHEWVLLVTTSF